MNEVTRAEVSNIAFGFMASKALFVAYIVIFLLLSKNPMN